jgi:hypothetical protein
MHYISVQVVTGAVTDIVCCNSSEKCAECPTGHEESYRTWTVSVKCRVYVQSIFAVFQLLCEFDRIQSLPLLGVYSLHLSAVQLTLFMEGSQSADLQFISRHHSCWKYFMTQFLSKNIGSFSLNTVFQFLQYMWTLHMTSIFHHHPQRDLNMAIYEAITF